MNRKDNTTPLLCVDNLSVAFHQGAEDVTVVDGVSFEIDVGETLALVGESGSGKSITAQTIMGLLPYPMAFHPGGEIWFKGENLLSLKKKQWQSVRGNRIGMIFQEPMTALNPLHTVEKQIGEVICQHRGIKSKQARAVVIELLEQVQIPDPERRLTAYPHELSGGQRQRVMIAMALANEPELLLADEPTTALDVTVQREILELLKELQRKRSLAMLLITHDLGVVRYMADRVAVMREGQLLEQQPTQALFDRPQHPYTREMIDSEPSGQPAATPEHSGEVLLDLNQVKVSFPTRKNLWGTPVEFFHAVKEATLTLPKAKTLGIVGESGSGKSTLAMAILRLLESEGEIRFQQQRLDGLKEKQLRPLRQHLQIVFQDPFASLSPRMTIAQIISEGLEIHHQLAGEEREQKVIGAMQEVGLDPDMRHRYPHEFSGGQRQRIAIARAMILNPRLVILDEPTSALDKAVQAQVVDLLRKLQESRGLSYIFISHDLKVVKALSHDIIVMKEGSIVEYGRTSSVLSSPREQYTRDLMEASFGV